MTLAFIVTDLSGNLFLYLLTSYIVAQMTIMYLLVWWKKRLVVWTSASMLTARLVYVIIMFKLIELKTPGLESVDLKEMQASISLSATVLLIVFSCNMKIEMCLSVPIAIASN